MLLNGRLAAPPQHVTRPGGHLVHQCLVRTCQHSIRISAAAHNTAGVHNHAESKSPSTTSSDKRTSSAKEQQLIDWIRLHGGFVHPSLIVVDNAPCGCRGMVASRDMHMPQHLLEQQQQLAQVDSAHGQALQDCSGADLDEANWLQLSAACAGHLMPVIAVPEELYMTTEDAEQILGDAIRQYTQQARDSNSNTAGMVIRSLAQQLLGQHHQQQLAESLTKLQPPLLLALLLAYERTKGQDSWWYPYISALPEEPPCGWFPLLQQQQQQQHSPQQHEHVIPEAVAAAAAAVQSKCSGTAKLFGAALGITTDDIIWAFGQVVSRAFGSGDVVGLAPLIDMLNHKQGSGTPQLLTVPVTEVQVAAGNNAAPGGVGVHAHGGLAMGGEDHEAGDSLVEGSRRFWAVCLAPKQQQQQQQQQHHMSERQQQHVVLSAGDELYISYVASCDALTAFLNFGFVPPEKV